MADIELVIKIPEYYYENNIKKDLPIYLTEDNIIKILPKGHKRLIEDNFEVGPVFDEEGNIKGYQYVTQYELDNAPTIIEADSEVE